MAKPSHKELIKADIRIKFGSLRAFEQAKALPHDSVRDVLRGRQSARTQAAIATALGKPVLKLFPHHRAPVPKMGESSTKRDSTRLTGQAHRLSRVAG